MHAQGFRPRGVPVQLALALDRVLPSAQGDSVSTATRCDFGAQYLAWTYPYYRFVAGRTTDPHSSGPRRFATPFSYDSLIRYTSPIIPALPPTPPHHPNG